MTIIWEAHEETGEALMSRCRICSASVDPVYGYYRLFYLEDETVSIGEGSLADVTRLASLFKDRQASEDGGLPAADGQDLQSQET